MKIKLDKKTISTILWLLGELISLLRNVSRDNKDNKFGEMFHDTAEKLTAARCYMRFIKELKKKEDHEQK